MREHPRKKKDEHSLPSPLLPANMTLEVTLNSTQDVIRRTSAPRMFIDMIAKQNLNNRAFAIFLYRVLLFLCDFPTLAYTSFPAKLIIDYFRVTCMTTSRTVYRKEIKRDRAQKVFLMRPLHPGRGSRRTALHEPYPPQQSPQQRGPVPWEALVH